MALKFTIEDCWNTMGIYAPLGVRCEKLQALLHCRNCPHYIEVGSSLLSQELDPEYRQELTRIFSQEKPQVHQDTFSTFVFKAGSEWFALSSSVIMEVVEMRMIHTVPYRKDRTFRGLVNIRGKLELCFSIGRVLGIERADQLDPKQYHSPERLVVAEWERFRMVFPVTKVMGSVRVNKKDLQEVPVIVSHAKSAFTKGIFTHNNKDIGLLDESLLFPKLLQQLS
ncbi:MAG: chemotaxis protein CheW [Deltaproteobacteria bacterium]